MSGKKRLSLCLTCDLARQLYDEMLGMRRQIRKEREETVYAAMEAKRQIANNVAILGLSLGIVGVLGGGIYLLMSVL